MRKIVFILTIFMLGVSCSVSRKQSRSKSVVRETNNSANICENIVNQNLTTKSFFIEKAEFKIKSGEGEKSGIGTMKFLMPDIFLISIKSHAGIEIVRIFITGDSIMVNDRFNKKLFYGSTSYLKNKYGLTTSLLPLIWGDYVNDNRLDCNNIKCEDNKINVDGVVKSVRIKYMIDCELGKAILTMPEDNRKENVLEINYSEFFKTNNINTPGKIEISERQSNTTIEIRIQKIVSPWKGTIEFIPGKQYEKIRLL